ncbi:Coronin-like protein crn1 [Umbelopsis sp. WA50703]
MSRFVRPSKYRHVYGTAAKRDQCYDNLRVTNNAWDSNIVKTNPLFVAVNWQSSGGGSFVVIPHDTVGKLPDNYPQYRGHTAAVLDTDFHPFNDYVIASGAEDSKVMIWNIPEKYKEEDQEDIEPVLKLSGHGRKVGQVLFHPTANNVLASASTDLTIKLWDIEKGQERQEITGHKEIIQSMAYNYNGSLMATTCRDKKLRIFDLRSNKVVQEGAGHQGVKGSRVVWLGESDRIVTTGFSRMSDRQMNLWNTADLSKPIKGEFLDTSSGVLMPFYDQDTKMLYLAGKGDGNIRYFEYENDELFFLSAYQSPEPQRGMAFLPKRSVNVSECEVVRAYKVTSSLVEPISFKVPRKSDAFQSDIYPPAIGDEPALTADEWFGGKDANPKTIDLEAGYTVKAKQEFVTSATAEAPAALADKSSEAAKPAAASSDNDSAKLRKENEDLKDSLAQKDVKIRNLELEIEKLKTSLAEINLTKKVESTTSPTAPSEEPISQAAAGAATAAAEEGTDGVVSSNAVTDDSADVELPHNSNALTE